MEKVTERKIERVERGHDFYCDRCGKYLGSSEEYDDGYYHKIGNFELKLYTDKWLVLNKHYCNECRRQFLSKLNLILKELGFGEG